MPHRVGVAAVAIMAVVASGCSRSATDATPTATGPGPAPVTGDITVFAAASLTATFTELGKRFEATNPGAHVALSFAGSADLVAQLKAGAPADVFASADITNMNKATDAKLVVGTPVSFAKNTLTIVTSPGNPKHIASFADLAKSGTAVVVCAPQVPCGSATKKVETVAHTELRPVSEESSVTDVLGKVMSGQADAGLVYVTDASGAGDKVTTVAFPESAGVVNTYPIAQLADARNHVGAERFIAFVAGPAGRKVLTDAGFAQP